MRMAITGGVSAFDVDQMMELDMDVHHHSANQPSQALTTMADALPGLGIVAAVLGVVVTMGSLGGPPEEIGRKVAAALVGTFLGILLCYGLVGPLASNMSKIVDEEHSYYHVLRVMMLALSKALLPLWRLKWAAAQFPSTLARAFLKWRRHAGRKLGSPRLNSKPHRAQKPWLPTNRSSSSRRRRPRRPPRRRLEGGLCRFCHRADGTLFIVLWLMNSSKPVQDAVGGYFRDPNGTAQKKGTQLGGAGDAGPSEERRHGQVEGRSDEGHGKDGQLRQAQEAD
jgi:hypothetical protein